MSHKARFIGLMAAFAVACSFVVADQPKTLVDYVRKQGSGINVSVPQRVLDRDRVDRWQCILTASDEQVRFIEREYDRFVEQYNEFLDSELPPYLEMSAEMMELWKTEGGNSPNVAALMKRMDRRAARLRRRATAIEHSFIDTFAPVLSDEQMERLHIVRSAATRRNCRTFPTFVRWNDVELRPVWGQSGGELASAAEADVVEAILADYESRLTTLICRQADLQFETRQRLIENRIARVQRTISKAEADARYQQIWQKNFEIARAVRVLHEQTVQRVEDVVSDNAASAFVDAAKQATFPELYPDPHALHDLFGALLDDDGLNDEAFNAIRVIFNGYGVEYEQLCDQLETVCVTWGDQNAKGVYGYHAQRLPEELEPTLQQRRDLAVETLHAMAVHPAIADHLREHIDHNPADLRDALPLMPDVDSDEE